MTMNNAVARRRVLQVTVGTGALGLLGCATASSASAATPELRKGSSGAAVRDLQTKLAGVGYWLGTVDGSFGHMTQQAVYAIQKYHGLSRDGVCGPNTWSKVNLRRRPRARSLSYTHIEVDKPRQLIFAVSGGVTQMCFNTSTGSNKPFEAWGNWYNGQTPSGHFECFRYESGWYNNALGGLYRPYFFNGAIAIHGSKSIPPYNASHGCCRVSVAGQDQLLRTGFLKKGRKVWVY